MICRETEMKPRRDLRVGCSGSPALMSVRSSGCVDSCAIASTSAVSPLIHLGHRSCHSISRQQPNQPRGALEAGGPSQPPSRQRSTPPTR
jgi:hypothetical protein